MIHPRLLIEVLVLIALANGAPLIAKKVLRARFAWPIDCGAQFFDRHPLFGPSKTIRGLICALAVVSVSAWIMGLGLTVGLTIALAAMLGDLI